MISSLLSENLKEGNAAPIVLETAFFYDVRVNVHLWQGCRVTMKSLISELMSVSYSQKKFLIGKFFDKLFL